MNKNIKFYNEIEMIYDECLKNRPKIKNLDGIKIWGQKTTMGRIPKMKKFLNKIKKHLDLCLKERKEER